MVSATDIAETAKTILDRIGDRNKASKSYRKRPGDPEPDDFEVIYTGGRLKIGKIAGVPEDDVEDGATDKDVLMIRYYQYTGAGLTIISYTDNVLIADVSNDEVLFVNNAVLKDGRWIDILQWISAHLDGLAGFKKFRDDLVRYREQIVVWRGIEIEIGADRNVTSYFTLPPSLFRWKNERMVMFDYATTPFQPSIKGDYDAWCYEVLNTEWYRNIYCTIKRQEALRQPGNLGRPRVEAATVNDFANFLEI